MTELIYESEASWWLFFGLTFVVFLIFVEIGYRFGRWRRSRQEDATEHKSQAGTVLAAMLALLGFLLAISFGVAADRFATRKALVLEEANAIGTAFLRTDFLPEQQRVASRKYLFDYTEARVSYVEAGDPSKLEDLLDRSSELHALLWEHVDQAFETRPRSVAIGLYVTALNEVIDLHEERLTVAVRYRIPPSLLWTLYFVSLLSMGTMGLHFGFSGTRNFAATAALVASFAAVFLLIVDLDSPRQHLFEVSQDPLFDALMTIESGLESDRPIGGGATEQ